jgi:hypothetical protein
MSRALLTVGTGVACWLTLNQSVMAQPPMPRPVIQPRPRPQVEVRQDRRYGAVTEIRRVSSVIGARVTIREDVPIGAIEDVVLSEDGCIDFLVVAYESRLILVPFSVARLDFERRTAFIDITREKFRSVPTFTKDRWPSLTDRRFVSEIHTAFGIEPGHERRFERREGERRFDRKEDQRLERREGERRYDKEGERKSYKKEDERRKQEDRDK